MLENPYYYVEDRVAAAPNRGEWRDRLRGVLVWLLAFSVVLLVLYPWSAWAAA